MYVKLHDNRKIYYNESGLTHREDGPAIIWKSGRRKWFYFGLPTIKYGPTEYHPNGCYRWVDDPYPESKHFCGRQDGPALDHPNGRKIWQHKEFGKWPKL